MNRPLQGVGIGLRRQHYDEVLTTSRRIDWLEIVPENFMARGGRDADVLAQCAERWPGIAHGVALSLGGPDPLSEAYLGPLDALLQRLDPPYFSEHVCYSAAHGVVFHDLLPLPFVDEAVRHVSDRMRAVEE